MPVPVTDLEDPLVDEPVPVTSAPEEVAVTNPELVAVAVLEPVVVVVESDLVEESSVQDRRMTLAKECANQKTSWGEEFRDSGSILTNCVAVGLADVGVELQGLLGLVAAAIGDAGLDLLGVIAADAGQVGRVGGVAGRGISFAVGQSRDLGERLTQ